MPVKRLDCIDGPALVFVTTTATDWKRVFKNPQIARQIALHLAATADHYDASIAGYVVMPSHVHMLVGLRDVTALSKAVQFFKSMSSRHIRSIMQSGLDGTEGDFKLWMRRFDEVIIVSEVQFETKLQYIHNNPVKAGVVANAVDWKYSSARDWLMNEEGLVPIEKNYGWLI